MLLIFSSCYQNLKNIWGKIDGSSIGSLIPFILFFVFVCSFTIFHSAFALSSFIIYLSSLLSAFIYSFSIHQLILSLFLSSLHPFFLSFIFSFFLLSFHSFIHSFIHSFFLSSFLSFFYTCVHPFTFRFTPSSINSSLYLMNV